MSKEPRKQPYSWYRWQMRPRLYDEEKLASQNAAEEQEKKEEPIELEKGDLFAMILSAMLTIFPICVGILLLIVGLAYFLFIH